MPIHDWTRVDAGLFHHFHQDWTIELCRALNRGVLPPGFSALTDQVAGPTGPDVLTLNRPAPDRTRPTRSGAVAVAEPPTARFVEVMDEEERYTRTANRVAITHRHGRVVAVIEVVSPGNKSKNGILEFLRKSTELLTQGVHLLVIDLFPPTPHVPHGIHRAVWDEFTTSRFEPPADKPLTAVAYQARPVKKAYIEPLAVGDDLPAMPVFLADSEEHVLAPLEATYRASWDAFPVDLKELVEPHTPEPQS
jgi:hypothetical protein